MMETYSDEIFCKDRLSSLPDDILINIISFLPLNHVVVTSVLSHRWQHLWTQINSFNVIDTFNVYEQSIWFRRFDGMLKKLTSPSIVRLNLSINGFAYANTSFVDSWLLKVCARNVEKIKVCVNSFTWKVLLCVFQTSSLVELVLEQVNYFILPCVINLPNLKKLSITKGYASNPSIKLFEKIINSCSSLEDLYFDLWVLEEDKFSDVNIKLQNLKKLDMRLEPFNCALVIDAPNLEYVTVKRPRTMKNRFVEDQIALFGAHLRVDIDEDTVVSKFLESFVQSVRFLELHGIPFGLQESFSYLTCLKLRFSEAWEFKLLIKFLELSPALKVLRLKIDLNCTSDWRCEEWQSWRIAQSKTNINKIEIEGSQVFWHKPMLEMVNFLVRCARKELEQLIYGIDDKYSATFEKELLKCLEKVKKVENYEVELSGTNSWRFKACF